MSSTILTPCKVNHGLFQSTLELTEFGDKFTMHWWITSLVLSIICIRCERVDYQENGKTKTTYVISPKSFEKLCPLELSSSPLAQKIHSVCISRLLDQAQAEWKAKGENSNALSFFPRAFKLGYRPDWLTPDIERRLTIPQEEARKLRDTIERAKKIDRFFTAFSTRVWSFYSHLSSKAEQAHKSLKLAVPLSYLQGLGPITTLHDMLQAHVNLISIAQDSAQQLDAIVKDYESIVRTIIGVLNIQLAYAQSSIGISQAIEIMEAYSLTDHPDIRFKQVDLLRYKEWLQKHVFEFNPNIKLEDLRRAYEVGKQALKDSLTGYQEYVTEDDYLNPISELLDNPASVQVPDLDLLERDGRLPDACAGNLFFSFRMSQIDKRMKSLFDAVKSSQHLPIGIKVGSNTLQMPANPSKAYQSFENAVASFDEDAKTFQALLPGKTAEWQRKAKLAKELAELDEKEVDAIKGYNFTSTQGAAQDVLFTELPGLRAKCEAGSEHARQLEEEEEKILMNLSPYSMDIDLKWYHRLPAPVKQKIAPPEELEKFRPILSGYFHVMKRRAFLYVIARYDHWNKIVLQKSA